MNESRPNDSGIALDAECIIDHFAGPGASADFGLCREDAETLSPKLEKGAGRRSKGTDLSFNLRRTDEKIDPRFGLVDLGGVGHANVRLRLRRIGFGFGQDLDQQFRAQFGEFMFSDNVILYAAWFGNLQFAMLGLGYAALRPERRGSNLRATP